MNEYIIILKGCNKDFAVIEFTMLWNTYFNENVNLNQIQNALYSFSSKHLIEKEHPILKRLTLTNFISKKLYAGNDFEDFKKNITNFDIEKYDGKSFLVRIKKAKKNQKTVFVEKELAKPIWDLFKNPKVSIANPDIEFNFVIDDTDKFYFAIKIFENNRDYLRRMPKLRPVKMPYTLKSDMARAAINLLELKRGIVLDPFCGIGGILLEAKDMNFDIIGNDISWNDLNYFKENFDYFFPHSNYLRTLADSQTQFLKENTIDGIVTDIPYGKCSRKHGNKLYESFLKSSKIYLKPGKRLIVIYANFVEFKRLATKYFTEVVEIEEYINKSMTRYILVLENKK